MCVPVGHRLRHLLNTTENSSFSGFLLGILRIPEIFVLNFGAWRRYYSRDCCVSVANFSVSFLCFILLFPLCFVEDRTATQTGVV